MSDIQKFDPQLVEFAEAFNTTPEALSMFLGSEGYAIADLEDHEIRAYVHDHFMQGSKSSKTSNQEPPSVGTRLEESMKEAFEEFSSDMKAFEDYWVNQFKQREVQAQQTVEDAIISNIGHLGLSQNFRQKLRSKTRSEFVTN